MLNPALMELRRGALFLGALFMFALPLPGLAELTPVPARSVPRDYQLSSQVLRQQIEEDWLRQAEAIQEGNSGEVTPDTDARGGCDGIKDGKYAFHTAQEPNPWWQVDLGEVTLITHGA